MRRSLKWLFTSPKYQNSTNSNTFLFSFLRFPLSRNSGEEVLITDVRHSDLSISFPIISSWPFWFNIYKIIWRNLMPASQIKRLLYRGLNKCLLSSMRKAHPQIVHYHALDRLLFVLVTVFLQGFVICFTSLGRRTEFTPPHRISSTKKKFSRDWAARVARFSYTNPSNFRRSMPPLLLRYIYDWTFSGYLILIRSFSSCQHYFSKVNHFHVSRKAYIWIFHWLPGWTVLNWLLRGESSKVLTHYVTKNNGNLVQTSEPIVITDSKVEHLSFVFLSAFRDIFS